jgi:hypothetical protein
MVQKKAFGWELKLRDCSLTPHNWSSLCQAKLKAGYLLINELTILERKRQSMRVYLRFVLICGCQLSSASAGASGRMGLTALNPTRKARNMSANSNYMPPHHLRIYETKITD